MHAASWLIRSALIGQAAATLVLTGLALVVQIVVYPGLITVGRSSPQAWTAVHAAHCQRIAYAVGPAWLIEGITCATLLIDRDPRLPLWQPAVAGTLGLVTVAATGAWAVPLHQRLGQAYSDDAAHRLLQANILRLLAWAAAGGLALVMLDTG